MQKKKQSFKDIGALKNITTPYNRLNKKDINKSKEKCKDQSCIHHPEDFNGFKKNCVNFQT